MGCHSHATPPAFPADVSDRPQARTAGCSQTSRRAGHPEQRAPPASSGHLRSCADFSAVLQCFKQRCTYEKSSRYIMPYQWMDSAPTGQQRRSKEWIICCEMMSKLCAGALRTRAIGRRFHADPAAVQIGGWTPLQWRYGGDGKQHAPVPF